MDLAAFTSTPKNIFFTKNDSKDIRLGDLATSIDAKTSTDQSSPTFFIAGYPDDEGIQNNGGRPGAAEGPNAIRSRLYRMTPPAFTEKPKDIRIADLGNLKVSSMPLKERHEAASNLASLALKKNNCRWVGLGGGHDYGYAEGDAFLSHHLEKGHRPLIINFDAHLDVRPLKSDGTITSGTPFHRLLTKYKAQFDFLEVGLQPFCNSRDHYLWLKEMGGQCLTMEEIRTQSSPLLELILEKIEPGPAKKSRPCFLSVDIDVFSTTHAPGCSQSWPSGMVPFEFFPCFEQLCNIFHVDTLGIYEVAPPLDQDDQTAKLAAEVVYRFLFQ